MSGQFCEPKIRLHKFMLFIAFIGLINSAMAQNLSRRRQNLDPKNARYEKMLKAEEEKEVPQRPSRPEVGPWLFYPENSHLGKLSYALGFSFGIPGNVLSGLSIGWYAEARYYPWELNRNFDFGLFYKGTKSSGSDTVYFEETGYTEVRDYSVMTTAIGINSRYRVWKWVHAAVGTGINFTSSKLSNIETDEPSGYSSLTKGDKVSIGVGIPLTLGAVYEYRWEKHAFGAELGYHMSGINLKESLREPYILLYARLFHLPWKMPENTGW